MGRYRTFANDEQKDFNQYYDKINGKTIYKYARTHSSEYNNYINPNFLMNNCPSTTDMNEDTTRKGILIYKDYKTLINLSKTASYLNPACNVCADVPTQLNDGLQSEICYDKLYRTYNDNPCSNGKKIAIIDICKEKSGISYPYGVFNNNKKNPPIQIHSIKDLQPCQDNLRCKSYQYCKCPPWMDCKLCKYKVVTPIDENSNITYIEDNYNIKNNEDNELHNDDDSIITGLDNPDSYSHNKTQSDVDFSSIPLYMRERVLRLKKIKDQATAEAKNLTANAIHIFSKSNPNL